MTKIDQALKKTAENMSRESTPTSSSTESRRPTQGAGDPNCPICAGLGFVRRDVEMTDPDFGKVQPCECLQRRASNSVSRMNTGSLDAYADKNFDNFRVRGRLGLGDAQVESLNLSLNQARQFAQTHQGWMLFAGGYGSGKTHLAAAIANFAVQMSVATLFLTVPDLLDWLRASYDSASESYQKRFDDIRNIQLLVLDDLGTQNATAWATEKLFQIINHRYVQQLPTVITTNQDLTDLDGRIRSRLEDADLVTMVRMNAPDFRRSLKETGPSELSSLEMLSSRVFGSFSLRENEKLPADEVQSLRKAFESAQGFAEKPKGWLLLMGGYGCGKTHLAAAIGNYRKGLGEAPVFVVVPDLLDHLRATFSPSSNTSYDDLFNMVRTASLLIMDDLGTQSATPWAREKLYQIFNYRYVAELPTVVTTSSTLDELDPRIRSRMLDARLCSPFAITAPAYRPTTGNLKERAGTARHSVARKK